MKTTIRKIKNKLKEVKDNLKPFIRTMDYKGFKVFYSKDTSLIREIIKEKDNTYESELSEVIAKFLSSKESSILLDIGANIGLISLNVLHRVPSLKIHAFEPGPHQYNLFQKTIQENAITNINLHKIALSNKKGVANFAIHDSAHVSGDGFIDTGRAGDFQTIEVETDTIDNWWKANGSIKIDFIKIDTEGAELWVLEGAKECIKQNKPPIILEIFPENMQNYPYDENAVYDLLTSYGYTLHTFANEKVGKEALHKYMGKIASYLALPN